MISRDTAFSSLQTLFLAKPGTSLSVAEVIETWGRTAYTEQQNRRWLANKLVPWRRYGLIQTIYKPNNQGRGQLIDRVQLTPTGEQAVDQGAMPLTPATVPQAEATSTIGLQDILRLFERLKRQHPDASLDIELKVTGRDASGELLVTPKTARIELLPDREAMDPMRPLAL